MIAGRRAGYVGWEPLPQFNSVSQVAGTSDSPTTTGGDGTVTDGVFDTSGIRVMRRVTEVKNGDPAPAVTTVYLGDTEITFNQASKSAQRTLTRSYTTPGGKRPRLDAASF